MQQLFTQSTEYKPSPFWSILESLKKIHNVSCHLYKAPAFLNIRPHKRGVLIVCQISWNLDVTCICSLSSHTPPPSCLLGSLPSVARKTVPSSAWKTDGSYPTVILSQLQWNKITFLSRNCIQHFVPHFYFQMGQASLWNLFLPVTRFSKLLMYLLIVLFGVITAFLIKSLPCCWTHR